MRVKLHSFWLRDIYHSQHSRASSISLAKAVHTTSLPKERSRRLSSTIIRSVHTKTYSPASIIAALADPSSFSTNQHVLIGPATYRLDEQQELYKVAEPWDSLSVVIQALENRPSIKSICIDMDHLIFHSAACDEILRYSANDAPEVILNALGLECRCTALCKWSLSSLPKTTIQHFPVRKLVCESFQYRLDEPKWKAFVAEQGHGRPELMACDYTAEFHSRDVCDPERHEGAFVNMGLFGQGNYVCGSLSDLSMRFAQDLMWNRELFAREPQRWRPDLYQSIRDRKGSIISTLEFDDGDE